MGALDDLMTETNDKTSTSNLDALLSTVEKPKKSLLSESISNIPSSGINFLKNTITPLIHPLNTIEGIATVFAGGMEKLFPQKNLSPRGQEMSIQHQQVFDNVKNYFSDRFGSVEGIKNAIRTDPVGMMADLSILFGVGGGMLGKAGEISKLSTVGKAGELVSKMGEYANPLNLAIKAAGEGLAGVSGVVSGRPYQAFREAFNRPNENFTEAMRGNIGGQDIVNTAMKGLENIKQNRADRYLEQLEKLKNSDKLIDITPIQQELVKQLRNFNVKIGEEGLDFSRSPINKSAQNDIEQIVKDVANWGKQSGDNTAIGLDILKRRIGDTYSESAQARAFTEKMYDTVKKTIIENVPEYQKLVSGYEDSTKIIKDMKSSLSLGGKAGVETTLKKLIFAMNDNNEFRKTLVDELEKSGATGLTSQIAGERLNQVLPGGLAKLTTTGGMIGGAYALGEKIISPEYLGAFALASPRLMGEFLRTLGLTNKAISMNLLNIYGNKGVNVGQMAFQAGRLANQSK